MSGRGDQFLRFQSPDIIIGKSIFTFKKTVLTVPTLLIDNNTYGKVYVIRFANPAIPVYIGGPGVTQESGFEIDSSDIFIFGMLENTKLYAIAPEETDLRILDMGL